MLRLSVLSYVFFIGAIVAVFGATRRTKAPVPTGPECTGPGSLNNTCPSGMDCCGGGGADPMCYNSTTSTCCRSGDSSTPCDRNESCCSSSAIAVCCAPETDCCTGSPSGGGACCAKDSSEQCCQSGGNGFCCGANEHCCASLCCGTHQICCGDGGFASCCDKVNQVCGSDNMCQYITQPPTYHPGPYANWSTVWSQTPSVAQVKRTPYGLLCNNVPLTLFMVDPKTGNTIWSIAGGFNVTGFTQLYTPVTLTNELIYLAGSGVNIQEGRVVWQENATAACAVGSIAAFPDGPTNVVISCTAASNENNDMIIMVFGIRTTDGTVRFTRSFNVTNSENYGVQAVARHMIVFQNNFVFYGIGSLSGKTMWSFTAPAAQGYLPSALITPATDAFIFTQGSNATALRLENGDVLWTQPNLVSNNFTTATVGTACQRVVRLNGNGTTGTEVVAWPFINGSLGFTETRTGNTALQTTVWAAPESSSCLLDSNANYLWSLSGTQVTAVLLKTAQVAWSTTHPDVLNIHVGSPTNDGPYVRARHNGLWRLSSTGEITHKFHLLPAAEPLTVAQYEADYVVATYDGVNLLAFELPHQ